VPSDASARRGRSSSQGPTIKDIAEQTGLSKATVSRAINGRDRISPSTRERVLMALDELGYMPSHAATSLSTGRTGLLGLMIGANRNPTALSAMQGALTAAVAAQYGVIVYITEKETEHDAVYTGVLASRGVDGALHLFPGKGDERYVRKMHDRGLPIVVIEPQAPMTGLPDRTVGHLPLAT
jgi:LacI family transcriptional regulator